MALPKFIRISDGAVVSERDIDPLCTIPSHNFRPNENDYSRIVETDQPDYNSVTQSIQESAPVQVDGVWNQQWEVIELFATQSERDAAIAADAEAKRLASIPTSVTMRQARLALHAAGLLSGVNAAISAMEEPAKTAATIEWEYASAVERNAGLVPAMAAALGMTASQIDDLFITAATL